MTVKEFVDGYNKTSENLKTRYIKEKLEIKDYISFSDKCNLVGSVINCSTFERTSNGDNTGNIRINSIVRHLLFVMSIIDTYTNIDVSIGDAMNEYDLLDKYGLIELFIGESGLISNVEYMKLQTLLNMKLDDTLQNHFSTQAFFMDQVDRFGKLTGMTLAPVIDKLIESINGLDDSKIDKIGKAIGKAINKL